MTSNWRADANCKGLNPDMFFPARAEHAQVKFALDVCSGCTVKQPCLDYAIENSEREGVWGGLPANQRRKLRSTMLAPDRVVVCEHCGEEFLGHVRSRLCSEACRTQRAAEVRVQYRHGAA